MNISAFVTKTFRYISLIILLAGVLVLNCCKSENKRPIVLPDYTLRKFMLQDSVAEVEIYLPNELDTFLRWLDVSDNTCSDMMRYRFASRRFNPIADTGYFKTFADSTYQLTISHINEFRCKRNPPPIDTANLNKELVRIKQIRSDDGDSIPQITGEIVNYEQRNFAIVSYTVFSGFPDRRRKTVVINATTIIDSSYLSFTYATDATNVQGFTERMKQSLQTIKINEIKGKAVAR